MKEFEAGSFPFLDTCRRIEGGGLVYSMSLLAFCSFHGRKDMMDLLLTYGAGNSAVILIIMKAHCAYRIYEFNGQGLNF